MEKIKVVGEKETKKLHNTQILREIVRSRWVWLWEREREKKKKKWGEEKSYLESKDGEQRERKTEPKLKSWIWREEKEWLGGINIETWILKNESRAFKKKKIPHLMISERFWAGLQIQAINLMEIENLLFLWCQT